VIFALILPQIEAGANPVLMVVMGSVIIIPIVFLLSHGWQKKTLVAIISTLFCMVITGILIIVFVDYANLTGLESEEAGFIKAMSADLINLKNLLIAGMLIAILGVLDDITVAQAGIVSELKAANPQLSGKELYQRAMKIGQDHIASMINTLILVYAGASFPLLLLFLRSGQGITLTLNFEVVASEIVRTLTGSLGLIMAVPLTTFLAVMGEVMFKSAPKKFKGAKRNSSLKGE
jgi:uncharacterized membrane protein